MACRLALRACLTVKIPDARVPALRVTRSEARRSRAVMTQLRLPAPLPSAPTTTMADDELAEINGIKPKLVIKDGEEVEAKSQTRCASRSSAVLPSPW